MSKIGFKNAYSEAEKCLVSKAEGENEGRWGGIFLYSETAKNLGL
jgi:hypothetical protein